MRVAEAAAAAAAALVAAGAADEQLGNDSQPRPVSATHCTPSSAGVTRRLARASPRAPPTFKRVLAALVDAHRLLAPARLLQPLEHLPLLLHRAHLGPLFDFERALQRASGHMAAQWAALRRRGSGSPGMLLGSAARRTPPCMPAAPALPAGRSRRVSTRGGGAAAAHHRRRRTCSCVCMCSTRYTSLNWPSPIFLSTRHCVSPTVSPGRSAGILSRPPGAPSALTPSGNEWEPPDQTVFGARPAT